MKYNVFFCWSFLSCKIRDLRGAGTRCKAQRFQRIREADTFWEWSKEYDDLALVGQRRVLGLVDIPSKKKPKRSFNYAGRARTLGRESRRPAIARTALEGPRSERSDKVRENGNLRACSRATTPRPRGPHQRRVLRTLEEPVAP
ncbi:hypothetical protein NDU88_006584 [Pleurodeles waltl]|uniref:Uncharacterized protein n=1 Tax=Pleurodeles waltl TaxID=8319 RepID=A0AAV7NYH9_PLEWA|nr:hypothetical protein NDU88_006584 [Pleurodeles waltl]